MLAYEATASLHRLNQKPGANRKPNNSLTKANFANLQKSQASACHKSEIICLYVCLWIREGGKAQKVSKSSSASYGLHQHPFIKAGLDSLYFAYPNSENLSTALADIQKRVKEAYEASSIGKASNFMGEYNFDQYEVPLIFLYVLIANHVAIHESDPRTASAAVPMRFIFISPRLLQQVLCRHSSAIASQTACL